MYYTIKIAINETQETTVIYTFMDRYHISLKTYLGLNEHFIQQEHFLDG